MLLALALGIFASSPVSAVAAPILNRAPAITAGVRSGTTPCLIVATSGCPVAPASTPISVAAPGAVVVVGANWTPGMTVTVLLVSAAQSCATAPSAVTQANASTAGVFSVTLTLPANAPNGTLYAVCAATADGKQTFPPAGLIAGSPLRIRVLRAQPSAAHTSTLPIDGFSLAALVLAALSAGVFALTWLRGRRAKADAER